MKLTRNYKGRGMYLVFDTSDKAQKWRWFFGFILRRRLSNCNGYENAWELWA